MSATKHMTFNCPACGTMRCGLPDHPKDISQDAARDLLEALKIAYRSLAQLKAGDELIQIRAAIAKAERRD